MSSVLELDEHVDAVVWRGGVYGRKGEAGGRQEEEKEEIITSNRYVTKRPHLIWYTNSEV